MYGRTKYIDKKLKVIYNVTRESNIEIACIPTNIQTAVLFTKAVPKFKFYELSCLCCL